MSGDIFSCHKWREGATGSQRVEARNAAKHPTMDRMAPTRERSNLKYQECQGWESWGLTRPSLTSPCVTPDGPAEDRRSCQLRFYEGCTVHGAGRTASRLIPGIWQMPQSSPWEEARETSPLSLQIPQEAFPSVGPLPTGLSHNPSNCLDNDKSNIKISNLPGKRTTV